MAERPVLVGLIPQAVVLDPGDTVSWISDAGNLKVEFDANQDMLTFRRMQGQDENYIQVVGEVSDQQLRLDSAEPASFTFTSPDVGRALKVFCLQGTSAARQLRKLTTTSVSMIVLRNIDWSEALQGRYVINLLAIDIQPS